MYYLNSRYYNPEWGRFLNADGITGNNGELLSHNLFSYCKNNPVNMEDPSGYLPNWAKWAIGAAIIATAAVAVVASAGTASPLLAVALANPVALGAFSGAVIGGAAGAYGGYQEGGWDGAADGFLTGTTFGAVTGYLESGGSLRAKASSSPKITKPYARPSGSVTKAQRASVQGKACVTCGIDDCGKRVADHIKPLVVEYYETGTIDLVRMRSLNAVQAQCPTCSARQGGQLSAYSKRMRSLFGLDD